MTVDVMSSPYRDRARPELVVYGEPNTTIYIWSLWIASAGLVVMTLIAQNGARARAVVLAAVMAALAGLWVLYRMARRAKWLICIDGNDVRIERRSGTRSETLVVDVSQGVRLRVGVTEGTGRVDECVILTSGDARVTMTAGVRPAETIALLTEFFRAHGVTVDTSERRS